MATGLREGRVRDGARAPVPASLVRSRRGPTAEAGRSPEATAAVQLCCQAHCGACGCSGPLPAVRRTGGQWAPLLCSWELHALASVQSPSSGRPTSAGEQLVMSSRPGDTLGEPVERPHLQCRWQKITETQMPFLQDKPSLEDFPAYGWLFLNKADRALPRLEGAQGPLVVPTMDCSAAAPLTS
ncbi:V-type proton ATPase subunit S1-like [Dromiciops gliroides]|uniref:V-type proton ATPase subunit S1-like n=1 Tax=Dromiciops gliroides TaxID=33562 RepID=UPI001CC5C5C4|nr:V-type proton ATPase subunit S1-like [Dromiciops gliroides]